MSKKQIEVGQAQFNLNIGGQPYVLRPVKMARRPSAVQADWLAFQRGYVGGGEMPEKIADELRSFMLVNNTEAVFDGANCFTAVGNRLVYCDPTAVSDFPVFRVLGAHANGNFFDIRVQARDGLSAFGAAALEMKVAGDEGDATFHVAIPEGAVYFQPGDSLVSLETVLDPEQADVFGLAERSSSEDDEPFGASSARAAEGSVIEASQGVSLRLNTPAFFKDPEFIAWLNNGSPKFTWHQGGNPGDYSDVIVLVEPNLEGEGTDSDMPEHIWKQIVEAVREKLGAGGNEVVTVRLTNLEA